MKKKLFFFILKLALIGVFISTMYFIPPTKEEVENYFEKNNNKNTYQIRRTTGMLWGQIFNIPTQWFLPKFMLYTTTPFNYYNNLTHSEDEFYKYTWVDTKEGIFVYNTINGEYIMKIDNKEHPSKTLLEQQQNQLNYLISKRE